MNLHLTTPFGRRPLTAAQIGAQAKAAGCPDAITVNKWSVFRDIAAARARLGLSDRALAVLDALLTFHPDTTLTRGEGCELVVFPSNAALSLRAHGMAEPSLRRHLAALVEAGIVIRRDSPNGKRYARRGQGGEVSQAFGFDITPLVARAAEFAAEAQAVRAAALALRIARERLTLLRRDCMKLILALEEAESGEGSAEPLRTRYRTILAALGRSAGLTELGTAAEALSALSVDVGNLLLAHLDTPETSGNAPQDERHKQSSNPNPPDSEPAFKMTRKEPSPGLEPKAVEAGRSGGVRGDTYPLGIVLDACPDITDYAREGIRTWRDLVETANVARSALGISPHAWREAQDVMGADTAAVTVAAILQRCERIKSPGGYLRSLVERKRAGEYSLAPVLQALIRARLKERENPVPADAVNRRLGR